MKNLRRRDNDEDLSYSQLDTTNHHPDLYLLAIERKGWRRWIFGRWVHKSESLRRDIQKRHKDKDYKHRLKSWETISGQK